MFVRYTITVKGDALQNPVEKSVDVNSGGKHSRDNITLVSRLSPGKYSVTLFLHAQFAK